MKKILSLFLSLLLLLTACTAKTPTTSYDGENSEVVFSNVSNESNEILKHTEDSGKNIIELEERVEEAEFVLFAASEGSKDSFEIEKRNKHHDLWKVQLLSNSLLLYDREDVKNMVEYTIFGETVKLYYVASQKVGNNIYDYYKTDIYDAEHKVNLTIDSQSGKIMSYAPFIKECYSEEKVTSDEAIEMAYKYINEIHGEDLKNTDYSVLVYETQFIASSRYVDGYIIDFVKIYSGYRSEDRIRVKIGLDGSLYSFYAIKKGISDVYSSKLEEGRIISAENFAKAEICRENSYVKDEYFLESEIVFDVNLKPYLRVCYYYSDSNRHYSYLVNLT